MDGPKEHFAIGALYAKVREKSFARVEHFLSESQRSALVALAEKLTTDSRKVIIQNEDIATHTELGALCRQLTYTEAGNSFVPNTVIVKYYDPQESQLSAAYEFHKDPPHFEGFLNLISLTSHALLEVKDVHGDPHSFHCKAGTLVTVLAENGGLFSNENPEHRVTQPVAERRYFVFIGMTQVKI